MSTSRSAWTSGAAGLLALCCVVGCATPFSKPPLSVDAQAEALSHFSIGLLAAASGDSATALRELESAIRLDPGAANLYPPAVAIALQTEQPDTALRLARQLKKQTPDDPKALLLFAQVTAISGQNAEAELLLQQVVSEFPEEADAHLNLARFFTAQNRFSEAVQALEAAIEEHPDHVELLILLAQLYSENEKGRDVNESPKNPSALLKGIRFLEKAVETDPSNPALWQQIGHLNILLQQFDKALYAMEKARAGLPGDVLLARQVLDLCLLKKSFDRAFELLDELPVQTGTDPEIWIQYLAENTLPEHRDRLIEYLEEQVEQTHPPVSYFAMLSSLYLDSERHAEAAATLKTALTAHPEDHRLRTVLGTLHMRQERYEDAYAAFSHVRTAAPNSEWAKSPFFALNFMVAAQKTDHLDDAVSTLVSTYTDDPSVLNQYMHSLLTGESPVSPAAAIDLLESFRLLRPQSVEALYYLTVLQAAEKKYEAALETARHFEVLAQSQGQTNLLDGRFYYQYGSLHERTGRRTEAEPLFFKAIERGDPAMVAASQNYLAYMWAEHGEKLEMALELVQKALTSDPDNAAFIDTLGWIYYMQGRYEEALGRLKAALDIFQDDSTIWEHLGDTYLKLGDPIAARKHWEKALDLAPEDRGLMDRLGKEQVSPVDRPAEEGDPADTPPHP